MFMRLDFLTSSRIQFNLLLDNLYNFITIIILFNLIISKFNYFT